MNIVHDSRLDGSLGDRLFGVASIQLASSCTWTPKVAKKLFMMMNVDNHEKLGCVRYVYSKPVNAMPAFEVIVFSWSDFRQGYRKYPGLSCPSPSNHRLRLYFWLFAAYGKSIKHTPTLLCFLVSILQQINNRQSEENGSWWLQNCQLPMPIE